MELLKYTVNKLHEQQLEYLSGIAYEDQNALELVFLLPEEDEEISGGVTTEIKIVIDYDEFQNIKWYNFKITTEVGGTVFMEQHRFIVDVLKTLSAI